MWVVIHPQEVKNRLMFDKTTWMDRQEFQLRLGLSSATACRWGKRKVGPAAVLWKGKYYYRRSEVDGWERIAEERARAPRAVA